MSGKRKRVVLTIKDKLDIIRKLEDGGSSRQLAGAYGIGETTVRDIRRNKDKIISYASSADAAGLLARRKAMKPAAYEELDRAMLEWVAQQRARGSPLSAPLCAKRAEFFFYALGMDGDFHPAAGWLARFRQRHSLRGARVRGERAPGHEAAVADFCGRLRGLAAGRGLQPEQLYHAGETGLLWRCPPAGAAGAAGGAGARPAERLTVLCCANATGRHKLRLCVVGRARRPRAFRAADTANLPVSYFSQKGAWMDLSIFRQWFDRIFVPQVREHLRARGLQEKAVLLLDNSPPHPNESVLRSDDGQIFAKHLPPHVASLIQPSDQGVVAAMKRNYRAGLLQSNLDEGNDLKAFWKKLTLLDALYEVAAAWSRVPPATICRAWRKILPALEEKEGLDLGGEETSVATVASLSQHTRGLEHLSAEHLEKWLEVDSAEPGYQVLTDSEIIRRAQGRTDESSENEEEEIELIPERRIDHAAALQWTENLLDYLEQQGDMVLPDRLVIRKLRATIRNKQKVTSPSE